MITERGTRTDSSLSHRIGRDTIGVSLVGAATRLAPLLSTIAIAAIYGAGNNLDVYFLTLVVPVFLSGLMGMAITSVFVPVLVEEQQKDPESFPRLRASMFSYVTLIALGMSLVYGAAAPLVIPVLCGALDDSGRELAVTISLWLSPVIVLTVVRSFLTAVYHSRKRFILPTVAMSLSPLVMVAFVLTLGESLGIYALVTGTVAGHLLVVVVMVTGLVPAHELPRFTPVFDPRLKRIFRLASPQVLSGSVLRISPIIDRSMASLLAVGSISALVYAERMQSIPQQILSLGFFNVVLAHWSFENIDGGMKAVGESLVQVQKALITVLIPFVVFFWLYRVPVTRALLERGTLNRESTELIATVFGVYAFQILPLLLNLVYVRVMLVMKDTLFLMRMGFFTAGSRLVLNCLFILVLGLGVWGIALAAVLTSWLGFLIFNHALKRRLGRAPFRPDLRQILTVTGATALAAASSGVLWSRAELIYGNTVALLLVTALYFLGYVFFLYVFREHQYFLLRRLILGDRS